VWALGQQLPIFTPANCSEELDLSEKVSPGRAPCAMTTGKTWSNERECHARQRPNRHPPRRHDAVVRLGLIEGDFHTVPKGMMHRTRAPARTAILMVEAAGVIPAGD
jgi:hypothetical protein